MRDFPRLGHPLERMKTGDEGPGLRIGGRVGYPRQRPAGQQRVGADTLGSVLHGDGLYQPDQTGLAGGIGPHARQRRRMTDERAGEKQRAATTRTQGRYLGARGMKGGGEVGGDHFVPLLDRRVGQHRPRPQNPGIVEGAVQPAIGLHRLAHQRVGIARIGHVARYRAGLAAGLGDLPGDAAQLLFPPRPEDQARALPRKQVGGRAPDPA